MALLVVVVCCAAVAVSATGRSGGETDARCDAAVLKPTVTFLVDSVCNKAAGQLSFTNEACWAPHVPTLEDVVLFPAGTAAESAFSWIYTPLRARSVVVARGAKVTLGGGAVQASECVQVAGELVLAATANADNTAASTEAFLADASSPLGTDCSTVARGYTPRLCGPGVVSVSGRLVARGHRASLFAPTRVQESGTLELQRLAYVWGAVTSAGTVESNGFYLQGRLTNEAAGRVHLTSVRIERFPLMDKFRPVTVVNRGTMQITSPGASEFWRYLSEKDGARGGRAGGAGGAAAVPTKMKFVNEGQLMMAELHYAHVFAGIDLDMFNVRGTITFTENHDLYLTGSMVNTNGVLVADQANVYLNDYVSQDGELRSANGGWFHFGSAAGVDTKTTVLCERKQKKLVKRTAPVQLAVHPFDAKTTNISCSPSQWDSCPNGLCCGAHGYCEEARCQNADGYGGGPVCCPDNAFCGGSSHGPYCGSGIFSWEVDPECMAELEYVDRFEFDVMQARFPDVALPRFGKHRYTMRGASRITSDGAHGGVAFTEPIEVRDELRVGAGATLSNLMDNGAVPFAGKGRVAVGGRFVGGIKTTFDASQPPVEVEAGGRLEVPAYGTIWMHDNTPLRVREGGALHVDGKVFVLKRAEGNGAGHGIQQCGTLGGSGGIVADAPLTCKK